MHTILLTTLNARYAHTALGLRYLYANLHELQEHTRIIEFTINEQVQSIAERLLEHSPRIIGIGVYIWNASQSAELIHILKKVSPETIIVLGGPEAGYHPHRVDLSRADYIISGEGEVAFYELCKKILSSRHSREGGNPALFSKMDPRVKPEDDGLPQLIRAPLPDLKSLLLPYGAYSDEDVAHRYIYVEASRGCPFECEFCLSSIDEKVRNFPLEKILSEFETLWERGVRSFKFIDRTFNLNMSFANAILDFFLSKEPPYFAHFEVIPDHFPESLRTKIARFPPGALQLEIGIQTLDPFIAKGINRPLKLEKIFENLRFLENETHAHMHLDLIVGLPGESLEGFGANLDKLVSLTHSEIQIGILKNLSGTTLSRHDASHGMVYSDIPPYDILCNNLLSYTTIQQMKRFARFWDMYYNSGNFDNTVRLLWSSPVIPAKAGIQLDPQEREEVLEPFGYDKLPTVFASFYAFSLWIYGQTLSTWKISLDRQTELLYTYLSDRCDPEILKKALAEDISKTPGRTLPRYLREEKQASLPEHHKSVIPKRQAKRI